MSKRSSRKKPRRVSLKQRMAAMQKIGRAPEVESMEPYKENIVEYLIKSMGGTDPVFVTEKEITTTDLDKHHDRIMFPAAKFKKVFLTEEEDEQLGGKRRREVLLVEPSLKKVSNIKLGKWYMGANVMYVLNGGWRYIATRKENHLGRGRKVQLWSFRLQEYLGFVLTNVGF